MRALPALAFVAALAPTTAFAGYDPCPSTDWGVSTIALEAEQAYLAGDTGDLLAARHDVRGGVECLDESITPETAAAVHRAFALAAFWDGDDAGAANAMQAALIAEPSWEPDPLLAPPGGDLDRLIRSARDEREPSRSTLTAPAGLALRLDGAPSWRKPDRLPVVLQLIDGQGQPMQTAYVPPGAPLPVGIFDGPVRDEPTKAPSMRVRSPSKGSRVLLVGGAGVLAAGAVGLGVSSAIIRADVAASEERCALRVEGCSPNTERWNEHDRMVAKRLGIGAGVAAAGALGLGVGVVVSW